MALYTIISLFWLTLHTSQSLMDLVDAVLIIFAVVIAIKNKEVRQLFLGYQYPWLWVVWTVVLIAGFVFGPPVEVAKAVSRVFEFRWFLSFLCYIYIFEKIQWDRRQILTLLGIVSVVCLSSLAIYFIKHEERAGGLFNHSMPFAHTLGPAILWFLYLGIKKIISPHLKWEKALWSLTLFFGFLLTLLTFTRGVWLGIFVGLFCGSLFLGKKFCFNILLTLLLVTGGLFLSSSRVRDRILGRTNIEIQVQSIEAESNGDRIALWKANWLIFKDYPIVGIGYGENSTHVREYFDKLGYPANQFLGHAHNQYIQFLSGTGILGLACFLFFVGVILAQGARYLFTQKLNILSEDRQLLLVGAYAGIVCFLVGGLTEVNFGIAKNRFLFLWLAAFLYSVVRTRKNTPHHS